MTMKSVCRRLMPDRIEEDDKVDPEVLWADLSISPEELVSLDPLEVTGEVVERAEQPEMADYVLMSLPPRRFSLRREEAERKARLAKCASDFERSWAQDVGAV